MEEDMPIEHRWITKAIENAQRKVEGHNYDIRKHLLEYDDVMNQQRKVVYAWRKEVLARENLKDMIFSMTEELSKAIAEDFFPNGKLRRVDGHSFLDLKELNDAVRVTLQIPSFIEEKEIQPFNNVGLSQLILQNAKTTYERKEHTLGSEMLRDLEKMILLTTIDHLWKDHLLAMDHLREGIGLQGYGQKDPLIEYKKQGFRFFEMMMNQITGDVVKKLFAVQLAHSELESDSDTQDHSHSHEPSKQKMQYNLTDNGDLAPQREEGGVALKASLQPARGVGAAGAGRSFMGLDRSHLSNPANPANPAKQLTLSHGATPIKATSDVARVGRNDICPCGSGKKYKKCHGA
jgi:preprotein translocase subunit SecA